MTFFFLFLHSFLNNKENVEKTFGLQEQLLINGFCYFSSIRSLIKPIVSKQTFLHNSLSWATSSKLSIPNCLGPF